jgi:uncharacterized protein YcfJ
MRISVMRTLLPEIAMNGLLKNGMVVAGLAFATQAFAQVTFYERENFAGRSFSTEEQIANFQRHGFNDLASSALVSRERWEVCENAQFGGRCVVLRPGRYPSLEAMGMNNRVSSVRTVGTGAYIEDSRYAPGPAHDYRRRSSERVYEANVTSVRAVVGPPEQRCWVEHEQVAVGSNKTNVPAAIAGAVIGGVLGHQIGGGRGQDLATVGGAVAGAALGSNVGRSGAGTQTQTRDVQRCTSTPSQARPEFWDVTYTFRDQEHRVQMTSPPGATITVNERGEPRE